MSKWVIVSFLYICFCRCYPGCRSSLAAYYTKQFLRSYDFVGSLKNRRFGGKRTTKLHLQVHIERLYHVYWWQLFRYQPINRWSSIHDTKLYALLSCSIVWSLLNMLCSLGTVLQCLEWDVGIFGFGHF